MIPINMNANFDQDGKIIPKFYLWDGIKIQVDGISRRWEDQDSFHFLALIPGDQIVELIFSKKDLRWYFKQVQDIF